MGGYDSDQAYETCGVDPGKFQSVCMIAIGKKGPAELLEEPLRSREVPSERKPLVEIIKFMSKL